MKRALLVFVFSLCCLAQAHAAFTVTDEGSASDRSGATGVQFVGASENAGDVLYILVWIANTTTAPTVSDGTNSFSPTQSVTIPTSPVGKLYGFFFQYSITESFLVISVAKGSTANCLMTITDISGSNGTWDSSYSSGSGASAGGVTPATTASASAALTGELNIAPIMWTGAVTLTNSSGWTTPPVEHSLANAVSTTTVNIGGGNIVNSGTSALSYSGSFGGGSATWGMFIDAFEQSGVGAAKCNLMMLGVGC